MRQRQRRGHTDTLDKGQGAGVSAPGGGIAPGDARGSAAHAADLPRLTGDILARVRAQRPRVHCITNAVAQTFTANMLLACGAVPSMTIAPDEIADFVAGADALLVNLGTFDAQRRAAVDAAIAAGTANGVPWLLDPVFINRAPPRAAYARALVDKGPRIVRLNQAELAALAGIDEAPTSVARYAADRQTVVARTGATDCVADTTRVAVIHNGHVLMTRVTAMGCAGSALVAACMAVEDDPWRAAAAGLIALGVAGEIAARQAAGPGTFAPAILDAVYGLDADAIVAQARVS